MKRFWCVWCVLAGLAIACAKDTDSEEKVIPTCDWLEPEVESTSQADAPCCGFNEGDRLCKKYGIGTPADLMECQSDGSFEKVEECESRLTETLELDCFDDNGGDAYCGGGYG